MNNSDLVIGHKNEQAVLKKFDTALTMFREIFSKDENYRSLTGRIVNNNMLMVAAAILNRIFG